MAGWFHVRVWGFSNPITVTLFLADLGIGQSVWLIIAAFADYIRQSFAMSMP